MDTFEYFWGIFFGTFWYFLYFLVLFNAFELSGDLGLDMAEMAGNGWTWQSMAGHGWISFKHFGFCLISHCI